MSNHRFCLRSAPRPSSCFLISCASSLSACSLSLHLFSSGFRTFFELPQRPWKRSPGSSVHNLYLISGGRFQKTGIDHSVSIVATAANFQKLFFEVFYLK